jgi:hypothetical protein
MRSEHRRNLKVAADQQRNSRRMTLREAHKLVYGVKPASPKGTPLMM